SKRVPLHESLRRNRRQMVPAQRKIHRRRQIERMLCGRVTLSSRSHDNFISHRNTGNRFSRRTKKISATRRSLQLARRCSFRRSVSQGRTSQRTAEIGAPRKESDARTHRTPKALEIYRACCSVSQQL